MYNPCVDGVRLGSVVEVDGQLGQVESFTADDKLVVKMINGSSSEVGVDKVRKTTPKRPGQGGDENSFDLMYSTTTAGELFAEEISNCLFEKGFCVLKLCQSFEDCDAAIETLKKADEEGELQRLPEEVEEGYLGEGAAGKVCFLDAESTLESGFLQAMDTTFSYLAGILQPTSEEMLGAKIFERSAALVSLSLSDEEMSEYPYPIAEDKELQDYLSLWQRSLLKMCYFGGPGVPKVLLQKKETSPNLPKKIEEVTIGASRNTLVIYRPDCYFMGVNVEKGEVLSLSASILKPPVQFYFPKEMLDDMKDDVEIEWVGPGHGPSNKNVNVKNMACRLPACLDTFSQYEETLLQGIDMGIEIPFIRFSYLPYYEPDDTIAQTWQTYTKHMSYVEGIETFDHKYFEIQERDVKTMGIMQRQVLEVGGDALYQLGITKKFAARNPHHAGCSVGLDKDDWNSIDIGFENQGGNNVQAIISNRFSFAFNLKGPNYVADTACSAALTATHLARLSMHNEYDPLDFFVCMGAHQCLSIGPFVGNCASRMAPPIGRCLTFDATACGYMRGDGCTAIIAKLEGIEEDKEAVMRATQVGQNGRSATLTAPNGLAQEDVMNKAIKEAKMNPKESCLWDCHGTGTSLGDPIEVGAIRKIQIKVDRESSLVINTNKANLGHLEGGAAMGSILAIISEIRHCSADPSIHLRQLNPHLENSQFDAFFNSEPGAIQKSDGATYNQVTIHVSSFGFGGSNAHGIFWGQNVSAMPSDGLTVFNQKLKTLPPPEIRPNGKNPDEWEHDFPDVQKPGETYSVVTTGNTQKWVKTEVSSGMDQDAGDSSNFYCITGNFNSWELEPMLDGDVPGQRTITLPIPDDGYLEFRFAVNGDPEQILAPGSEKCQRKTSPVLGPMESTSNSWMALGDTTKDMRIDLFINKGKASLMWLQR